MQPLPTDRLYSFSVPNDFSLLQALRQQLWAAIVTNHWLGQGLNAQSVPAHLVQNGAIVYVSALPQRLLTNFAPPNPDLQTVGKLLLEQLQALPQNHSSPLWQGWVNQNGYLCCQPSAIAIAVWLNQLLHGQPSACNALSPASPLSASSIVLQYIYIRCLQLQPSGGDTDPTISIETMMAAAPSDYQLLVALVALWDASTSNRQVLSTSQRLVEQFLKLEQTYYLTHQVNRQLAQAKSSLVAATQITVAGILQRHWGMQPPLPW